MELKEEEDFKKEFQLERVVLFTDAVFAIILTIMVLDIKLPEAINNFSDEQTKHAFKELILKFVAYFLTFALVARFWMAHLKLFRYLKDYDQRLLILNLFFLFTVTLFPFAVSLITRKVDPETSEFSWTWTIYVLVIYSTVFTQSLITRYLIKNREQLCINTPNLEDNFQWKVNRVNIFIIPVLMAIIVGFNFFKLPYYYPIYTVAAYGILISRIKKAYYPPINDGPILVRLYKYVKNKRVKKPSAIKK